MGAWIEIGVVLGPGITRVVAPHMGAWIEILKRGEDALSSPVAPHMGAWIEICLSITATQAMMSHPTWVRGLKYRIPILN